MASCRVCIRRHPSAWGSKHRTSSCASLFRPSFDQQAPQDLNLQPSVLEADAPPVELSACIRGVGGAGIPASVALASGRGHCCQCFCPMCPIRLSACVPHHHHEVKVYASFQGSCLAAFSNLRTVVRKHILRTGPALAFGNACPLSWIERNAMLCRYYPHFLWWIRPAHRC